MTFVRFLAFIFILTFLELWFFPLPFCFIALFLWQQLYSEEQALTGAFLAGFLFDIFLIRTLGTTSLFFIALLFVNILYKRKYASYNLIFLGTSIFFSTIALEFFLHAHVAIEASMFSTIVTLLLARIFSTKRASYESWYRIS